MLITHNIKFPNNNCPIFFSISERCEGSAPFVTFLHHRSVSFFLWTFRCHSLLDRFTKPATISLELIHLIRSSTASVNPWTTEYGRKAETNTKSGSSTLHLFIVSIPVRKWKPYSKIIWCFENDFETKNEFQMYNYKVTWGFICTLFQNHMVFRKWFRN